MNTRPGGTDEAGLVELLLGDYTDVGGLLESLDLHVDVHHPVVAFGATPALEHH